MPASVADLVLANRILSQQGVLDSSGEVSLRSDRRPDRYFLARDTAAARVAEEDILEFALDGEPVDGQARSLPSERFLHAEIYAARPDVRAIVHSHSPAVIPFGLSSVPLRPVYHMSSFLGTGVKVFEIRQIAGMTDLQIRNRALGRAAAEELGPGAVMLMRGHGAVVVGETLPQAVFRAVYTDMNARLQAQAMALGTVTFLEAEEATLATATNDAVLLKSWDLWKRQIEDHM